jgi:hypothetical protein
MCMECIVEYVIVFNYADDNTVSCYGQNVIDVKRDLENVLGERFNWFKLNEMKVNNEKSQLILFSRTIWDSHRRIHHCGRHGNTKPNCSKVTGCIP